MQDIITKVSQAVTGIKILPTITSTPYTAGDSYGGKQALNRTAAQIHSLCILDKQNQKPALDIFIFDVDPTAATTTDNSPFVFSTNDVNVVARISVATGDYVTVNSEAVCQKSGLDLNVQGLNGANLFAVAVTSGTPTQAAGGVQFVWGLTSS